MEKLKNKATPWLFLLIPLAFLFTFTYLPVANMISYSFTSWDGIDKTKDFVGLDNYIKIFEDPKIFRVFFVSLYYFVASFVQIAIALYLATVLSFSVRFRALFKGILFFPYMINGVAVGFIFLYLFQGGGALDITLSILGLEALIQQWLGNPDIVNVSLAGTSVWRYMGLNMVLFIGAIASIDPQLFEAAEIDGAKKWQQFRHIIAPGIKRITQLTLILAISGSLNVFEVPYIMLMGANGTETFVIQTVSKAFQFGKFGLASAMAVVLLVLVLAVTGIQRLIVKDERAELV